MVTGTRARSYDEMVDALAEEGLPALQDTLAELKPGDWDRPTLLRPPEPGKSVATTARCWGSPIAPGSLISSMPGREEISPPRSTSSVINMIPAPIR